jgi:hypothetical protein
MLVKDSFHITYCTNIHPGPDWQQTFNSLKAYLPHIKTRVAEGADFGVGLRLSNKASEELGTGDKLRDLKKWLDENGLYVFTMNGFPYGNFHNEPVKDMVHAPDWSHRERLQYTGRLFEQLAYLLPEGQSGGISTSPISYKHWHSTPSEKQKVLQEGARNMGKLILDLYRIEAGVGKYLHLDIEPEPDGLLENSKEVVDFFKEELEPVAVPYLCRELGIDTDAALKLIYRHVTVCYDICHFALAYESPALSFGNFKAAGIGVGKIQVSAALKIIFKKGEESSTWDALSAFNEPTYLHQVTELRGREVITYADLPDVLEERREFKELRAHFHVPVFLEHFGQLDSTQDQILEVLDYLKQHRITDQLEIETYTWEVLPEPLKKPLADSIVRELQWLKQRL